jgi:hypothetical protein
MTDVTPRTVEVKLDPEAHPDATPEDEVQRLTWEVLDTVWALLREYSVRVTLAEIRTQLEASDAFEALTSDEELFAAAKESGDPDACTGYMDLAPSPELAGQGLQSVFDTLVAEAFVDAAAGVVLAIEGQPDADHS